MSRRKIARNKSSEHVCYVFVNNRIIMERVCAEIKEDPFATFSEWAGEAGGRAYRAL